MTIKAKLAVACEIADVLDKEVPSKDVPNFSHIQRKLDILALVVANTDRRYHITYIKEV